MTPADLRAQDSREWLEKAAVDLRSAQALIDADIVSTALFHCQQAVEKTFKAFLTWHGVPFRRVHDLEETGRLCVAAEPALAEIVKRAEPLTEYAWKLRYPGDPYEPALSEAEESVLLARDVFARIRDLLPAAARPPE
jgi:HEPN domain-containing protein